MRPRSTASRSPWVVLVAIAGALLTGCADDADDAASLNLPQVRTQTHAVLMDDLAWIGGPYPDNLIYGLSRQLVDEINCIQPGILVPVPSLQEVGHLYTTRNVPMLMRPEVKEAAEGVARLHNDYITIRSTYRDVGMQYYDWYWGQRYNFAAARPGSSNHQGGQAMDVEYHAYWRQLLIDYGWSWPYGLDDQPHFEWIRNNTPDLKVESVRAFQRLWNRNNPNDPIGEDGSWGPQTETRMQQTHAEGFQFGGCDIDRDGASAEVIGGGDCDDARADIYPGAPEVCGDGIDQDCVDGDLPCGQPTDTSSGGSDTSAPDTNTPDTSSGGSDTSAPDTSSGGSDTNPPDTSASGDFDATTAAPPETPPDTNPPDTSASGSDTEPPTNPRLQAAAPEDDCQCSNLRASQTPQRAPISLWFALAACAVVLRRARRR